jgi:hypothetical protein
MEAAGAAEGGAEVVGMVATTADDAIGTLDTTDGTAAGDGGVAVLTRGGFSCRQSFQFQFRTQLTEDTATGRDTVTVQGTGTEEDTDFRSEEVSQVALKSHRSLPLLPPRRARRGRALSEIPAFPGLRPARDRNSS